MIDITDDVVAIVREAVGHAFLAWPRKMPAPPYAIIDMAGRAVEQADDDGSEVMVRVTYTIGVLASTPSEARTLALKAADAMAPYHFRVTGISGAYEEPNHLYRANVTIDGAVDRRGMCFS